MKSHRAHRAICILGMHRSGTSVITRAINLLGAYLGEEKDLYPPATANQKGFWERKDIVDIHNSILRHFGGGWYSFTPLPGKWHESEDIKPFKQELTELIRNNFEGHDLWAWKDPRTCLLLPLWIDVLNELGIELSCIYVIRNPLDIAKSHSKRDGFTFDKSLGLWFFYNISALRASHALPRYFIGYDKFLNNWELELRQCAAKLKLTWPDDESNMIEEMNAFISKDLRHSISKQDDLDDSRFPAPIIRLNRLLNNALELSSMDEEPDIKIIEHLYEEFTFYSRFILYDTDNIREMGRQLSHKDIMLSWKDSKVTQLEATINAQRDELTKMKTIIESKYLSTIRLLKNNIVRKCLGISIVSSMMRRMNKVIRMPQRIENRSFSHDPLYNSWIIKNEPDKTQIRELSAEIKLWTYNPKISIIVLLYSSTEYDINEFFKSTLNQLYENWELCILVRESDISNISDVIKGYSKKDSRVKYALFDENNSSSRNFNEALKAATGEYVVLLKQDVVLAPFALYEVVRQLNQNPAADFIYADEDKVSVLDGNRYEPFFKPDWSPDTFLSYNYLSHFAVLRKSIVDAIGGGRDECEAALEYDLLLRIIEKTDKIYHIPKILSHMRVVFSSGSEVESTENKSKASTAGKKAIKDYLNRKGLEADISDGVFKGSYRVKYRIIHPGKISIIIPTKDKVHLIKSCVSSILDKTDYKSYEVIIVDNESIKQETYDYYDTLKSEPRIKILHYNKTFNYSAINNYAVQSSDADYILLLNNDVEVINNEWLTAMLEFAKRKDVGAVGAKLYYPDDTIQHAGVILGLYGIADHAQRYFPSYSDGVNGRINIIQNLSAVTAACMMTRRSVYEEVGGLDETLTVAYNDIDLCLKIREKGYLIVYTPYAELYHYESASRGREDTPEKLTRAYQEYDFMKTKWKHILEAGDPYYNPNLTLENTDFSIKV